MDTASRRRIADAVKARRETLRMRQEDVSAAGGPSKAVMFQIENAADKGFSPATIGRLEDALRWQRGSITAIARGGEPIPLDYSDPEPEKIAPAPPVELSMEGLVVRLYRNPHSQSPVTDEVIERVAAALIREVNTIRREKSDQ